MSKALLNYTTTKPVWETVGEVQGLLAKHGATHVMTQYGDGGVITGIAFVVPTEHGPRQYSLPVRVVEVHRRLLELRENAGPNEGIRKKISKASLSERAPMVAWRILKDWLEAQLAIVEVGMAEVDQVMLPYMQVDAEGGTVYERYALHSGNLELGSGE